MLMEPDATAKRSEVAGAGAGAGAGVRHGAARGRLRVRIFCGREIAGWQPQMAGCWLKSLSLHRSSGWCGVVTAIGQRPRLKNILEYVSL